MVSITNGLRCDEASMHALATGGYGGEAALVPLSTGEYEIVAASDIAEAIGATGGALGDFLSHIVVTPLTLNPGAIAIKDGDGIPITLFAGGLASVSSLVPFTIDLGLRSVAGAWSITTGANVQVVAVGNFT